MVTKKRKSDTALKNQLFEKFYEFSFFKAVNLLENLSLDKKQLGMARSPSEEAVRFTVKPGFSFPASEISDLKEGGKNKAAQMEVAFMGLIGPSGVLPNWYNELAIERLHRKDKSFVSFLNIFHHRMISLFYLAWKKNRFPESYQPGASDRLSNYILSLAGLGTKGMVKNLGLPRESLTFYSGLLSRPVASAKGIETAIEYFSGSPVHVDQFIECDVLLEKEDQSSIGAANASLGVDAVCGSYIKECQTKFRVNIGPVKYKRFTRLMPKGDLLFPIFSLIKYMVGIEFEFEIKIFLNRDDVPGSTIGGMGKDAPQLGVSAWIAAKKYQYENDQFITFQEQYLLYLKNKQTINQTI